MSNIYSTNDVYNLEQKLQLLEIYEKSCKKSTDKLCEFMGEYIGKHPELKMDILRRGKIALHISFPSDCPVSFAICSIRPEDGNNGVRGWKINSSPTTVRVTLYDSDRKYYHLPSDDGDRDHTHVFGSHQDTLEHLLHIYNFGTNL